MATIDVTHLHKRYQDRIAALEAELAFYENRCSKCGSTLGLLHEDACPLCTARNELSEWKDKYEFVAKQWGTAYENAREFSGELSELREAASNYIEDVHNCTDIDDWHPIVNPGVKESEATLRAMLSEKG